MTVETFYSATVQPDWLDALNHVYFLEYQRAADKATDQFWIAVGGMPASSAETTLSVAIVETHVRYLRELRLGDAIEIRTRIVAFDRRRIHLEHAVMRSAESSCVINVLALAFDLATRTATHWPHAMLQEFGRRCERLQADRIGGLGVA